MAVFPAFSFAEEPTFFQSISNFFQAENAQPTFYKVESQSLEKTGISAEKLNAFFVQVENLLPNQMKRHFQEGIRVRFFHDNRSSANQVRGRALIRVNPPTIALNESLLWDVLAGEHASKPSYDGKGSLRFHKTMYREAMATVVHETLHLYDHLNLQTPEMKHKILECVVIQPDDSYKNQECQFYRDIKTTLSSNPYYLEAAGYFLTSAGNGTRSRENSFQFRSPDPYEFKNTEEHAAVNFEYFILDPDYHCRRPGLADFFSRHFRLPRKACATQFRYVDPDANELDAETKRVKNLFREIPADRVYQVHYLLADRGQSPMSRFGHSMLRLVICAPGQPKGPECLTKGLPYNLVLSFRAFVNTPQISNWAGLTGKYPSRLFVIPFEKVISEYTEVEYRNLKSYPLNLSEDEIRRLLNRSLETHWSYDSQYYFVSNNCAVETINLIRSALLRPELMNRTTIFPIDLLNLLLETKVASPIPRDETEGIQKGYYFESAEKLHLNSYARFFGQEISSRELHEFLSRSVAERRQLYWDRFAKMSRPIDEKMQMSAFQLEHFMLKKKRAEFHDGIARAIWSNQMGEVVTALKDLDLNELYKKSIEAFGILSAPYQILKHNNYGIPQDHEIQESEQEVAEVRKRIQSLRDVKKQAEIELQTNPKYREAKEIRQLINDILFFE